LTTLRAHVQAVIEKSGLDRETLVRDVRRVLEGAERSAA